MKTARWMLAIGALACASCAHRGERQAVDHPPPRPLAADECPPERCFPPEPPSKCAPGSVLSCQQLSADAVVKLCPDGKSVDGESGRCLKGPGGSCYREVLACPPARR